MDWQPFATLILGAGIAYTSAHLQRRQQNRADLDRWLRDLRVQKYAVLLEAFNIYLEALHHNLADVHDDEVPPDPIPSIGNSRLAFEKAASDVSLLGPSEVAELSIEMEYVGRHFTGSVGASSGHPYYSRWDKIFDLKNRYMKACLRALGTTEPPSSVSYEAYSAWLEEWKKPAT